MTDTTLTTPHTVRASHGVMLTDAAAQKVKALLAQEGRDDLRLRVAVQPGGCSGLAYELFFDEELDASDRVVDFGGVEVVVDEMSVPYLDGATVDFTDTIAQVGFTIDNPNAVGGCACGDSFSAAEGCCGGASAGGCACGSASAQAGGCACGGAH